MGKSVISLAKEHGFGRAMTVKSSSAAVVNKGKMAYILAPRT